MLHFPQELLKSEILSHLLIRDWQALNVAFASSAHTRAWARNIWLKYEYETPPTTTASYEDIKWLCSVRATVQSLRLSQDFHLDTIVYLTEHCPMLRSLDVTNPLRRGIWFTNEILVQLATRCPLLELLTIPSNFPVSGNAVTDLARSCKSLHTINIYNSGFVTDTAIHALCSFCLQLRHIGIPYSMSRDLTDAALIEIATTYPQLQGIDITATRFSDAGLLALAEQCHELRYVAVSGDRFHISSITALFCANPNIIEADLSHIYFLRSEDVINIASACRHLQKLNISRARFVYDDAIQALAMHCPQLHSLDINGCESISDIAIIDLAKNCPQLKMLNIARCGKLTDAALIALGENSRQLKYIDISADNVTIVGISALAAGCSLLQEFYNDTGNVTDACMVELTCHCRDLRRIDIGYCDSISNNAIAAIAQNCPFIAELYLNGCRVDDVWLRYISEQCINLVCLDISGGHVSQDAVRELIVSCRNLRQLWIGSCRQLNFDILKAEITKTYPALLMYNAEHDFMSL